MSKDVKRDKSVADAGISSIFSKGHEKYLCVDVEMVSKRGLSKGAFDKFLRSYLK